MAQIDYNAKLSGISQGTLELLRRELRDNPLFARHLQVVLMAKDPRKAVFQDMLSAVRRYVRGEELPYWYWWDLIDEVERFVDQEEYVPRPGDEGALLMRVLALKSIDAARAKRAYDNLPWKTYGKTEETGMGISFKPPKYFLGIKTPAQRRKQHRHRRQRRLAAATPEERKAYLEGLARRKEHRKRKTIASKFTEAYKEFGGVAGQVIGAVGSVVAVFFPIGTVIGAGLMIAGTAMTTHQKMMLARIAARAQEREMQKIQEDFENGNITAEEHNDLMKAIMLEEGEKLAAQGKLPPPEPEAEDLEPLVKVEEPVVEATKENISQMVVENKPLDTVKVPDAGELVEKEDQYVVDQADKLDASTADSTGLGPAQEQAKAQKQSAAAGTALILAAAAAPLMIGR